MEHAAGVIHQPEGGLGGFQTLVIRRKPGAEQPSTSLARFHLVDQGPELDEIEWHHSAGQVLPPQGIWETKRHHLGQRHRLCDAAPGFRLVVEPEKAVS
jgi:hypothetical protein